jgi:conserved oligomeric Golgi complex subunit 2
MGRLDEGGSRGECAGLFSLLDDMATTVAQAFGPVLRLTESMFDVGSKMEVDLITAGVWVPIATALLADAGIKMAIFSPGIASILQANYVALDKFLAELADRLLKEIPTDEAEKHLNDASPESKSYLVPSSHHFRPSMTPETIHRAQDRIYSHPKTTDFAKKWNLPIYYQLRFGECCNRLNNAIENTRTAGWVAEVFTSTEETAAWIKSKAGFELPLFLELYDVLRGLWRPDVILRPLTHRFLRGAVQLVGRTVAFIRDGMEGKIMFGVEKPEENGNGANSNGANFAHPTRSPYCWGDSEQDVAAVAWELAILETELRYDYVTTVCEALGSGGTTESHRTELRDLASEVLQEASGQIRPLVESSWNVVIVEILKSKCSGPLAAVKGVAATYRMTNRPPPTQASPFVSTILRPVKELDTEFCNRTPEYVGTQWKRLIVATVADRYAAAVEELIATVQRTEVALQNRRARRTAAGGMSDGDKVKLQLYLDFQEFARTVEDVGVELSSIAGIAQLKSLTVEAEQLLQQNENGK